MSDMEKHKKMKTKKGSILVFALVAVVIAAITLTSLLTYIASQIRYSKDRVERERAFQVAEAGAYYYRWYLAHTVAGKDAEQIKNFWESTSPYPKGVGTPYEVEYKDPEGSAIGKYKIEVTKPILGSTIVTVKSTGWTYLKPDVKRIVQVRFRRPSWSENSVLANENMNFGNGTVISGKIHSNKGIRFDAITDNVVSSSLASYDDPDHNDTNKEFGVHTHRTTCNPGTILWNGTNWYCSTMEWTGIPFVPAEAPPSTLQDRPEIFGAGRSFPVPTLDFNSIVSDISFMRSQATVKFDNTGKGRHIILKSSTMDVCKVNSYSAYVNATNGTNGITNYNGIISGATNGTNGNACTTNACCLAASCASLGGNKGKCVSATNYTIPDYGIIFVANNVWLEGTVDKKKISVVAAELVDEPGYTGGGKNVFVGMNDILYANSNGLADGSDVVGVIAQNDVDVVRDSKDTLILDGAFLAKEGRVGRESYTGLAKTTITVNGSIGTYSRYGFTYFTLATGLFANGYHNRNINFDNNMLYFPPPYFPTGTEYAIDLWDEL
jgi:hypothetical protein